MNKEITAEDFCFVCKDGGDLVICDYGDCLKAYHSRCLENNPVFTKTESYFKCGCHLCHYCKKSSNLKCLSCPKSLCWKCFRKHGDIAVVKELMGFCKHCLKLALMIEENTNVDSDGRTIDFNDTETYEFLFKDYWEIVKDSEKISLTELRHAAASLKNSSHLNLEFDSEKNETELSNAMDGEYQAEISPSHTSRVKSKNGYQKRQLERKYINGWGSEQLITFLTSIGEDCNEPIAQIDVSDIIRKYIRKNKLCNPIKKKKVKCDENLISLFNKKSIKLNNINALLDSHYSDNFGDDFFFGSEEENEWVDKKKRRIDQTKITKPKNDSEVPKSCYASVVAENIKLLYLRKSLLLELLKNSEEFENKVVGCFVRVKSNPNDLFYSRDIPYQLGQITGIRKTEDVKDTVLRFTNLVNKDINISRLSDVDFEEEECEDLRQLIKNGHVKRPMFVRLFFQLN